MEGLSAADPPLPYREGGFYRWLGSTAASARVDKRPVASSTGAPATSPSVGTTRLTREQVLALSPRPYEYLVVALQVLAKLPGEDEIRRRAVAAFEELGLTTAARRLAGERCPPGAEAIPVESRARTVRQNLGARPELAATLDVEGWLARGRGLEWYRARDGNIVRHDPVRGRWIGLMDQRTAAGRFAAEHFSAPIELPLVLEGIDPPWILLEAHARTPRRGDGFRPAIRVVDGDADRFLDALAMADLREVLARPGVDVFVGDGCEVRLLSFLRDRFDTRLVGAFIPAASLGASARSGAVLRAAEREQLDLHRALRERLAGLYQGRDAAWWARRYREIAAGGGPGRVLIPTCRYSTFVRHSSADLARSFERAGWRVECFMEPDDGSRFSSIAYLRRLAEFEPDLVVLINYTRTGLGEVFPANLPFVTWIQDAMPHLFDDRLGAAQGPLDFLAGHIFPELHRDHGYPAERALPFVVGADGGKFHPGPVDAARRARVECEVAYVSHHAETPDAMHERLCREGAKDPLVPRLFARLRGVAREVGEGTMGRTASQVLRRAVVEAIRAELGREPTEEMATLVVKQYAAPMAERHIRHQSLAWAASIARRRGWRLRLHGNGWDRHPTLGEFACPTLEHGEDLRASYASAAVHLHMSVHAVGHQRVLECLLSGGFPLCRLTEEERFNRVRYLRTRAFRGEAAATGHEGGMDGIAVADDADLMAMTRVRQLFGLPGEAVVWYKPERRAYLRSREEIPLERQGLWLLGDDPAHFFASEGELESRLAWAIESTGARRALARAGASRIEGRMTMDAFVRDLTGFVSRSLGAA